MLTLTLQLIKDELEKLGHTPNQATTGPAALHYRNPQRIAHIWHTNSGIILTKHDHTPTTDITNLANKLLNEPDNETRITEHNPANPTFNLQELITTHQWLTCQH